MDTELAGFVRAVGRSRAMTIMGTLILTLAVNLVTEDLMGEGDKPGMVGSDALIAAAILMTFAAWMMFYVEGVLQELTYGSTEGDSTAEPGGEREDDEAAYHAPWDFRDRYLPIFVTALILFAAGLIALFKG